MNSVKLTTAWQSRGGSMVAESRMCSCPREANLLLESIFDKANCRAHRESIRVTVCVEIDDDDRRDWLARICRRELSSYRAKKSKTKRPVKAVREIVKVTPANFGTGQSRQGFSEVQRPFVSSAFLAYSVTFDYP